MTCRMSLICGLCYCLTLATTPLAHGSETGSVIWSAGQPPATAAPAEPATEDPLALARQAAELAQRAATLAAANQSASASAAPDAEAASTAWKASESSNNTEIRFKSPGTAISTDMPGIPADADTALMPLPKIGVELIGEAGSEETPEQPATKHKDDHIQLVARMFTEGGMVNGGDSEMLPAAPDAPRHHGHVGDGYYGDPCCPPKRPLFWTAGVEATFLWPTLNRNEGAWFLIEEDEDDIWFSSFSDGVDSMYLSPRISLGIQGCKWGTNVRYFHLNASEGSFRSAHQQDGWEEEEWEWEADPNFGYFASSRLEAYTIDLEVTRRFCVYDCAMQASFGVRHARIEHGESVTGLSLDDDLRFSGFAHSARHSRGTGIVMGLYGRKPLFPCSCVHWFYNVRWSALWGPTQTSAETFASVIVDGASAGSVNGASTRVNDTLYIGEIQLGLEWNYALQCLPANAFFRAAVEYQRWDGGRGFSESGSFAGATIGDGGDEFTTVLSTYTSSAEPQMDLVGISIGTGLTW